MPVPFDGEPIPKPIRVAVTRNPHGYPIHPEISHAVERAAKWLAAAGYAVDDVEPPPITEPARAWFAVSVAEMKVTLFPVAQQHGSRTIQELFSWYERMGDVVDAAGYMLGVAERTRMTRRWSVFLEEYPLVLTPFLMRPMFSWNYDAQGFAQTKDIFDAAIYSYGVNYLGLPAGVVPIGLVDDLPAGVQIVGRRFREDLILDAMQAVESEVGVLAKTLWARELAGVPE
jgi:amidase